MDQLDSETRKRIIAALQILQEKRPTLGRPLVGTITGSKYQNMKELRPSSSSNSSIRILFIFDPSRKAILLLGGDKRGQWNKWYNQSIPLAEQRYDEYLQRTYQDSERK